MASEEPDRDRPDRPDRERTGEPVSQGGPGTHGEGRGTSGERTGTDGQGACGKASGPGVREIGVGPWEGPLPDDPRYDPILLAEGDRRNVVDRYRYWRREAIVADLDRTRHALNVAIENWEHYFNIGSIVRTANAFNVGAFHIIGRRRWNRRGAMVTDRYQHELHHESAAEFLAWARAEERAVLAIDNVPGSVPLETARLPLRAVMVFGQEGPGLSPEILAGADAVLAISQFGSTRSINAGAAAAVAMHAWIAQHAVLDGPGPGA